MIANETQKVNRFRLIQTQLVLGIGLILLLALIAGIIGLVSLRQVQASIEVTREEAGRIQELSKNLENSFLLARQDEENFLDNWRALGFEAVNEQYVVGGTQVYLDRAREDLASLTELFSATQNPQLRNLTTDAEQLPALLDEYEAAFIATVSQTEERSSAMGVEQTLRGQLSELENTVSALDRPDILQTILRIRANEQAYFSTGQQEYIDNIRILVSQFKDAINEIPPAELQAGDAPIGRQQLIGAIDTYFDTFNRLVGLDQQIEINTTIFKDVTADINALVENISQGATAGRDQARTRLQTVALQSRVALVITTLLVLVFGGGIAVWLIRKIIPPLEELTSATRQLGQGDLSRRVRIDSQDEFETLARGFNDMAAQLEVLVDSLEETVQTRTRRLELMATISERVSGILRVEELLYEVVNQINERFGYYHAHIYLLDNEGKKLIMAEGTGEAGAEMKAKGHFIPIEAETSLVARAARSGEIVKVDNVREAENWLPNPLLPDTQSEMAVPIVLAGENRVVGVLDVQENKLSGLDESDTNMLRYLSNQIAVAVQNARLFEQVEAALTAARESQHRYLEQAWQKYLSSKPLDDRKFEYVQPSAFELSPETERLIEQLTREAHQPAVVDVDPQPSQKQPGQPEKSSKVIVSPIAVQHKIIGSLKIYPMAEDQRWRDQDLALVEAVLNQFAQLVENFRLLDETQERASRERLIGQISDKLRRAPDFETLMKIGVDELSQVLQPSRIFVQMGAHDSQPATGEAASRPVPEETGEQTIVSDASTNGDQKQRPTNGRGDRQ